MCRFGVADFVDEDAFLIEGVGTVEEIDPLFDFLDCLIGCGGDDDQLKTVESGELDGAGLFRFIGCLEDVEAEDGEDGFQFFGQFTGKNVGRCGR